MLLLALLATSPFAAAQAGDPAAEEAPPLTWGATDARYAVTIPQDGPLTLTLEWRFAATKRGWAEIPLVGPELVVRSATGPVIAGPGGLFALLSPDAPTTVRVTGTLDRQGPGAARLRVLPAPRQRVTVDAPGLDVTVAGARDGWLGAADTLALTWKPAATATTAPPRALPPIVHAEATTAVWAEPGALISQTVARWRVVRGAVERFELDVAGLSEVDVEGVALARSTREGDRLVLIPRAPVKGTFEVRVRARRAAGDGEVAAPAPRPVASRVSRWWTVGRAEDGELVPLGGPRAVPSRELPAWGRGLSDTAIVSAWQGDAPLRVRLARYTPMMGPDTVIERAQLVVASAVEGRALVRTTWHVRNERKQYLHVTPPAGMRPMTARVSGEPVLVLSDGTGGVYIPLEKSVETVQGLLTFPVELTWIAEGPAWEKKGERALKLPAVDAPIQAAEWEVYLPRGVTAKGAAAPPPPSAKAAIEPEAGAEALQNAVTAYKNNDFTSSSAWLEQARASGSTDANVSRLQSNLDVLLSKDDDAPEDVATRRVRELANAKTIELQVEQEKKADEARRAYEAGDVDKAEAYLEEVISMADDIGVTEQKESEEQEGRKAAASQLLSQVKQEKSKRSSSKLFAAPEPPPPGAGGAPPQRPPSGGEPASQAGPVYREEEQSYYNDTPQYDRQVVADGDELDSTGDPAPEQPVAPATTSATTPAPPPPPEPTPAPTRDAQTVIQRVPGVAVSQEVVVTKSTGRKDVARKRPAAAPKSGKGAPADRDSDGVADRQDVADEDDVTVEDSKVRYKPQTEIDFESLDIEGELVKPSAANTVTAERKGAFSPLVKTRAGFDEEIAEEAGNGRFDGVDDMPIEAAPEAPPPDEATGVAAAKPAQKQRNEPEARRALEVKAAPLTLALPLDGQVVRQTTALLPAGESPTLTVPYKKSGESR